MIKVQNLSLKIHELSILEDLNFSVPAGAFFCVIGPNGAGKTLLTKTMLGAQSPSHGEILLDDQNTSRFDFRHIGYVPQTKTFDRRFPALTEELVASGIHSNWPWRLSKAVKARVQEALAKVGAVHLLGKNIDTLSGGELQRVYLARAFIRPRKILILDEPSTGIDTFGEADLYILLENFRKETGCLIMMITHDLKVAEHHSTHVLVLNRRQLAFGAPDLALSHDVIERAFGHSQHEHHHHHGAHQHA